MNLANFWDLFQSVKWVKEALRDFHSRLLSRFLLTQKLVENPFKDISFRGISNDVAQSFIKTVC